MSEQARAIGQSVKRAIARLERPGCPDDAICHHLGVNADSVDGISIGIKPHGGDTLITIYHRPSDGYPEATHTARAAAVAEAMGSEIVETWNGEDGHDGISVVIAYPCPAALIRSIANYRKLPNVFKLSDDENRRFGAFGAWWFSELAPVN